MPVQFIGDIDPSALFALNRSIKSAMTDLQKSNRAALEWAAITLAKSLAARTRKSPKLRKIVPNPLFKKDPFASLDMRRARFGVMRFDRAGNEYFVPIYRTAEYGRVRFTDRKRARLTYKDRFYEFDQTPDMSIKTSPKRMILRSGLAKITWTKLADWVRKGGEIRPLGVHNAAGRVVVKGGYANPEIQITNALRYIRRAIDPASVKLAVLAAADSLRWKVQDKVRKRMAIVARAS